MTDIKNTQQAASDNPTTESATALPTNSQSSQPTLPVSDGSVVAKPSLTTSTPANPKPTAVWSAEPEAANLWQKVVAYLTNSTGNSEEILRRRSILQAISIAAPVFGSFLFVFNLISPTPGVSQQALTYTLIFAFVLFGLVFWFSRTHQVQLAAWLMVGGSTFIVIFGSFFVWTSYTPGVLGLFILSVIVVLSGQTIDELAPFVVTGIGAPLIGLSFWKNGFFSGDSANTNLGLWFFSSIVLFILALLSWTSAKSARRSFSRMEEQNRLLVEANHRLSQNFQSNSATSNFIAGLADQLSRLSIEQSARTEEQVRSTTIVSTTLQVLRSTARQLADISEQVFKSSQQALSTAESGGSSVGQSIDGIDTLRQNVEHIATIVYDLSQQSNRIGQIVELITELADETNLLALNATIEAAGAGEHGRRFAVVAQEVQVLANRSRASARDVQSILNKISNAITNTLQATEQGRMVAQQLGDVAARSGAAIEEIVETVERTTLLARQIYVTTQQQDSATDEAVAMISDVSHATMETAQRAAELLSAGQQLAETAAQLKK